LLFIVVLTEIYVIKQLQLIILIHRHRRTIKFEVRAGHLQPTVGPRNSLRIRLRAARLCTYFEGVRGGLSSLSRCYLQTVS